MKCWLFKGCDLRGHTLIPLLLISQSLPTYLYPYPPIPWRRPFTLPGLQNFEREGKGPNKGCENVTRSLHSRASPAKAIFLPDSLPRSSASHCIVTFQSDLPVERFLFFFFLDVFLLLFLPSLFQLPLNKMKIQSISERLLNTHV